MDMNITTGSNVYTGLLSKFSLSFQQLIKNLGDNKLNVQVDRLITEEIELLKRKFADPNLTSNDQKELLVRMMYCEMLGHNVSFGYMKAVNFTQQRNLMEKRIAYSAMGLFLDSSTETESMMSIGSIQRDLVSSNLLEISFGLQGVCQLSHSYMLDVVAHQVLELIKHKSEVVRKKSIMALLRYHELQNEQCDKSIFYATLRDTDAGVMGVALNTYLIFIQEDATPFKHVIGDLICIFKQLLDGKLHQDFNFNGITSPWVQMKILQILRLLGEDDIDCSKQMYSILKKCLEQTKTEHAIGCAVVYECLKTIVSIHPNESLMQKAASKAGLFLISENYNLKYLGLSILSELVDLESIHQHQMSVIDCLNDDDETLKCRALDLLYHLTNDQNVKIVCERLMQQLHETCDDFTKKSLIKRITSIVERFSPDNEWYIDTMIEVMELSDGLLSNDCLHTMIKTIDEGPWDDNDGNESSIDLQKYAVLSCVEILDDGEDVPSTLLQLVCWVVGEYLHLMDSYNVIDVIEKLYGILEQPFSEPVTQSWVISAITKLSSYTDSASSHVKPIQRISFLTKDAFQRYAELWYFSSKEIHYNDLLSNETEDIDGKLTFLDVFVNTAIENGAKIYNKQMINSKPKTETNEKKKENESSLKYDSYPDVRNAQRAPLPFNKESTVKQQFKMERGKINKPVKTLWTKEGGYVGKTSTLNTSSSPNSSATPSSENSTTSSSKSNEERVQNEQFDIFKGTVITKEPNKVVTSQSKNYQADNVNELLAKKLFASTVSNRNSKQSGQSDKLRKARRSKPKNKDLLDLYDVGNTVEESSKNVLNFADSAINSNTDTGCENGTIDIPSNNGVDSMNQSEVETQCSMFYQLEINCNEPIIDASLDSSSTISLDLPIMHNKQTLPKKYQLFKRSSCITELTSDSNIRVTYHSLYTRTDAALAISLVNHTRLTLKGLCLTITVPSNLSTSKDPIAFHRDELKSMDTHTYVVDLKYCSPSLKMVMSGSLTYRDITLKEKRLFVNHELDVTLLLRALELSEDDFHSKWSDKSLYEKREKVKKDLRGQYLVGVLQAASIHPLQVTGSDILAAASLLEQHNVLFHFKVTQEHVVIKVKTYSNLLNNVLVKYFKNL